jgi:hypothetical protein
LGFALFRLSRMDLATILLKPGPAEAAAVTAADAIDTG